MRLLVTIFLLFISCLAVNAQPFTKVAFQSTDLMPGASLPTIEVSIAKSFLGCPYVANLLETTEDEQLIINFNAFDCYTFVETVLALTMAWHDLSDHQDTVQYDQLFRTILINLRYRNGVVDGYGSRLHYFSEWLYSNECKGFIREVTRELGGLQVSKSIYHMTSCAYKYPQLYDPSVNKQIADSEAALSRQLFWFIPKEQVRKLEANFQEGDLVMLMAARPGLDAKHVGFITWQKGRPHLLHASSEYGQVVISDDPLADYLAWNRQFSGIRVARLRGIYQSH